MSTVRQNNDWPITCNRYVGFIDIMGFKDMTTRLPHGEIYNLMKKIDASKSLNENIPWTGKEDKLVKTTSYSDSIMIYSKNNSFDSFKSFIATISGIIEDLFTSEIPFKGAVAYGKMTLDTTRSIFFGKPLIDSYLLQDELHFYGVIVHSSAEKEMNRFHNKIKTVFLTNYNCPLKLGSSYHWTIHPISADPIGDGKEDNKDFEDLMISVKKLKERTSGHLRRYIDNTEFYLSFVRNTKIQL